MELVFVPYEVIELLDTGTTESPEAFLIFLEDGMQSGELTLTEALDMLFDRFN